MQVAVRRIGHVIVDDNVHPLNVDAPADDVRGDHDPLHEVLEGGVASDALLLGHPGVDADTGKVAVVQQAIQFIGARNGLYKDDNLVEFEGIKEVRQLAILLPLLQLDKVLLQSVQRQLRLVINEYFQWLNR